MPPRRPLGSRSVHISFVGAVPWSASFAEHRHGTPVLDGGVRDTGALRPRSALLSASLLSRDEPPPLTEAGRVLARVLLPSPTFPCSPMTVDGIMSREVVTVPPDTALMDIRKRLQDGGVHHMLVIEDGILLGVISNRDVLEALSPFFDTYDEEHRDVEMLARPAREVMRTEPISVSPGTQVEEASHLLLDHDISSLPVVEGEKLMGIVTTKDFLNHYTNDP